MEQTSPQTESPGVPPVSPGVPEGASSLPSRRALVLGGSATLALGSGLVWPSSAQAAGIDTRAGLTAALRKYLAGRVGSVSLCVNDARDASTFYYNEYTSETLSTVKVLVLITLLRRSQERKVALTSSQRTLAAKMIRSSDNAATNTLVTQLGITTIRRVAHDIRMYSSTILGGTVAGSTSWWGYSRSDVTDLMRMVNIVVRGTYLTTANRAYAQSLMATVTASQRWGVCDPPLPTALTTWTKNGWGPRTGGYRVNSVGYVTGNGRRYTMAILSRSPNGFTYGRATVNAVSSMVYTALDKPLT